MACEMSGTTKSVGSCGDIVSTPSDLLKFVGALQAGRILNPHSLSLLTDPLFNAEPLGGTCVTASGYGAATIRLDQEELRGHYGHMPGYTSFMAWDPNSGSALVIAQNSGALDRSSPYMAGINDVARELFRLIRECRCE